MAIDWLTNGNLQLSYRIIGQPQHIRLPAPATAGPADNLWQHTCCEAFIAAIDAPEYREFNFAPSGQWATYRFTGYRQLDHDDRVAGAPNISLQRLSDGFLLSAEVPAALLPNGHPLQLGLSVVIEDLNAAKSYWALTHAAAQPDFHQPASFTYSLPRP